MSKPGCYKLCLNLVAGRNRHCYTDKEVQAVEPAEPGSNSQTETHETHTKLLMHPKTETSLVSDRSDVKFEDVSSRTASLHSKSDIYV